MTFKRQFLITLTFLLTSLVLANGTYAQDFGAAMEELQPIDMEGDNFRVTALLFGDAFSIQGHHLEDFDGESGWWTRRIYVTTDFANFGLGDTVIRLRLEVNQLDDFSTDYKSTLKDAYVQFNPGNHAIWLGRAPTLTFSAVEAHWGYRWFEKTPMDIQGTPSRMDGVRAKGPLTPNGPFYYRAVLGQGSDLGFEKGDDPVRLLCTRGDAGLQHHGRVLQLGSHVNLLADRLWQVTRHGGEQTVVVTGTPLAQPGRVAVLHCAG